MLSIPTIKLTRLSYYQDSHCVIGRLELKLDDEVLFHCDTLEPLISSYEHSRGYRIPEGAYFMHLAPSSKAGAKANGGLLPLIYNDLVPKKRKIRMHIGNSAADTRGCILLGARSHIEGFITSSAKTTARFLEFIGQGTIYTIVIEDRY